MGTWFKKTGIKYLSMQDSAIEINFVFSIVYMDIIKWFQDLARVRCCYIESMFLRNAASGFMIWGYGKDGRKLLSSYLSAEIASRCRGFVDVSEKKIGMSYFIKHANKHVKVYHFLDPEVKPPLLICVGSKIPAGQLEANIARLNLTEGIDYYHFS
jgi:hypothetical protein